MKNTILSIVVAVLFSAVAITPHSAKACFNGCYGYSQSSYAFSGDYYGYSYQNQTYYSPSYNVSGGGIDYRYNNPTHYSQSYYSSNNGYDYSYSYSYPAYQQPWYGSHRGY